MENTHFTDQSGRKTQLVQISLTMALTSLTSQISTSRVKRTQQTKSTQSSVLVRMSFCSQVSTTLTHRFTSNSTSKFFLVSEWQLWSPRMDNLAFRSLTELMQELQVSFLRLDRPNHQHYSNGVPITL